MIITRQVSSDPAANTTYQRHLRSGDFLIISNDAGQDSGDGIDEVHVWSYELCPEQLDAIPRVGYLLQSATLTVTLTLNGETNPMLDTQLVTGVLQSPIANCLDLANHGSQTVSMDLISKVGVSRAALLRQMRSMGKLHFRLGDDLLLKSASLTLTFAPDDA